MIVALPFVITQPLHRIAISNMFRMLLHEFLRAVPYRWDGLRILIQADDEAVLPLILRHNPERIKSNVAVKLDAWLDPPVPLVILHQWLAEEEARFETTHMSVAYGISVDNLPFCHVFPDFLGFILIDEIRERPMLFWYCTIVGRPRYQSRRDLLEIFIKLLVVKEHPIVVVIPVESIFDLTN